MRNSSSCPAEVLLVAGSARPYSVPFWAIAASAKRFASASQLAGPLMLKHRSPHCCLYLTESAAACLSKNLRPITCSEGATIFAQRVRAHVGFISLIACHGKNAFCCWDEPQRTKYEPCRDEPQRTKYEPCRASHGHVFEPIFEHGGFFCRDHHREVSELTNYLCFTYSYLLTAPLELIS